MAQKIGATARKDRKHAGCFLCATVLLALFNLVSPLICRGESSSPNGVVVSGWQFRLADSSPDAAAHSDAEQWHAAAVPSTAQTDLLRNGLIVDPFPGAHEAECQ